MARGTVRKEHKEENKGVWSISSGKMQHLQSQQLNSRAGLSHCVSLPAEQFCLQLCLGLVPGVELGAAQGRGLHVVQDSDVLALLPELVALGLQHPDKHVHGDLHHVLAARALQETPHTSPGASEGNQLSHSCLERVSGRKPFQFVCAVQCWQCLGSTCSWKTSCHSNTLQG